MAGGSALRGLAVAAAVGAAAAGCGTVSHDNPAFTGAPNAPATTPTTAAATGPTITQVTVGSVAIPQLAGGQGAPAVNAAVRALASGLGAGGRSCNLTTTRSDAALVSFRWLCSDRSVATATFSLPSGKRLALSDLLRGGYLQYMASTAQAQLTAGGTDAASASRLAAPTAAAFSRWGLSRSALQVSFPLPSGPVTVAYPVATLAPYLVPGGPLR
ncbi:hypothetical protein [Acidiferrimicrobium sp. IK]|uniref:hypothetical protein n=1 Tax=Acidiferrimicrobium sp. IK TaxID=2871700 RepID=UPI0021CB6F1F|nr:hypothetical protein [Acidiferrimicrobium sp. IK]